MRQVTLEDIVQKITLYKPRRITDKNAKRAGVFVPIYGEDERASIILTKRTLDVSSHKGEISFPGGVCEESDLNTKEAALRECFEEIGVKMEDLRIIGRLDDTYTITGYLISPYVGTVPYPYPFRVNPREVAYLIFLPIELIFDSDFRKEEPFFTYNGEKIYGATLRILRNLSSVLASP